MGALDIKLTEEQLAVLDSLPDDAKGMFADLLTDIGKAAEEEAAASLEEEYEDEEDEEEDEEDEEEELLSKADPSIRRLIEKYQKEAKTNADTAQQALELAKAEHDARMDREMLAKASEYKNLSGSPQDKANILKSAYAVSEDHGKTIEQMMKAANAQLDAAGVFTEFGKSAAGENSVEAEVERKAQELRKADPSITIEKARTLVFDADPSLYDRILRGG